MNLKILGAAALVAGTLGLAGAANAAPVAPASALAGDGLIERVAEGCGRGYFRNARGFCRPMRGGYGRPVYGRPVYGRPVYGRPVYGRRCFVRPGRHGPVRVCRW